MKSLHLFLASMSIAVLPFAVRADTLVPAGTLVDCTINESNLSSQSAAKGDPVLCYASPVERFSSRTVFPINSYLSGTLEDYRDPGHFVGKGWMELTFNRVVMGPGRIVPISAKIVKAPGLKVDKNGRIDGKGHATRDTIEWMIPVLWPEKVITLPMRGPRPVLREETRLTLKVMDDFLIPDDMRLGTEPSGPSLRQRSALPQRFNAPSSNVQTPYAVHYESQPAGAQSLTILVLRNGTTFLASSYWLDNTGGMVFVSPDGEPERLSMRSLDLGMTLAANQQRGISFRPRPASAPVLP